MSSLHVVVVGGTGLVGSEVVRELLRRGVSPSVITRSEEKGRSLPEGTTPLVGDLLDPDFVRSAFVRADAVFLLNAVSATETHEALMAVNGIRAGGAGRVVYLSVQDPERAPHLPHYGSKLGVEAALQASGLPTTILRPNNFFQNDLWLREALVSYGVYSQPIGSVGISRVDVRDIAEAAAIALVESGREGTYDLVGPDVLTGPDVADVWSGALGRPVRYGGDDVRAWEQENRAYMPPWMAYDFALMYRYFQDRGLTATTDALRRLTALLGRPPRTFAAFANEVAAEWASSDSP